MNRADVVLDIPIVRVTLAPDLAAAVECLAADLRFQRDGYKHDRRFYQMMGLECPTDVPPSRGVTEDRAVFMCERLRDRLIAALLDQSETVR
jgi:hypothetical protein